MASVTVQERQRDFRGVLDQLQPVEELVVTDGGRTVARLARDETALGPAKAGCNPRPGFWMAPDFDAPLDDFEEGGE